MYLLFISQEEGSNFQTFTNLEDAKSSYANSTSMPAARYNVGVAIYDLDKSARFGIGSYGFYGNPIEEWCNENL